MSMTTTILNRIRLQKSVTKLMKSRAIIVALGLLGATMIGGFAQTILWRWDIDILTYITNSQFLWVLLCFSVSWLWARGSIVGGILAGAITGLALIASYYLFQWLIDGWDAATSQFLGTRGIWWLLAAMGGGGLVGLLGGMSSLSVSQYPVRKMFGILTAALLVGAGPIAVLTFHGNVLDHEGIWVAALFFGMVGGLLAIIALNVGGIKAFLRGCLVSALVAAILLIGLLVAEQTFLYVTF